VLKAKARKNDADSPSYNQTINSPHAEKWLQAMETELNTLENDLRAWTLVKNEPWMNVLPMTWAFHLKHFSGGLIKKFKARFCVCGGMQVEGVDVFETWAPVIQWTTVHTKLILATKLDLALANITAAFVHANLGHEEHIYVHQAAGFQHDGNYVYKLNCSVYGLKQSPRNFFHYLSDHLVPQAVWCFLNSTLVCSSGNQLLQWFMLMMFSFILNIRTRLMASSMNSSPPEYIFVVKALLKVFWVCISQDLPLLWVTRSPFVSRA
jgi:hypothetical protein